MRERRLVAPREDIGRARSADFLGHADSFWLQYKLSFWLR